MAAKLHALGLQLADQLIVRIVLRAVESHMLGEVSETQLVFVLEDRTSVDGQTELHTAFGFLVGADVVGQAVAHLLVDRDLSGEIRFFLLLAANAAQLSKAHTGGCKQKQEQNKNLFLHFVIVF